MKKILMTISWAAYMVFALIVGVASLIVGAMVCDYVHDVVGLHDVWCLLLVPVMLIASVSVEMFILNCLAVRG